VFPSLAAIVDVDIEGAIVDVKAAVVVLKEAVLVALIETALIELEDMAALVELEDGVNELGATDATSTMKPGPKAAAACEDTLSVIWSAFDGSILKLASLLVVVI